ncbi:MAG: hypothetical protein O9262_08105, partial [Cyclobacteriaceae bacterium]|nr:hypothetical protein [Cyclobacteriaceae bacterium]
MVTATKNYLAPACYGDMLFAAAPLFTLKPLSVTQVLLSSIINLSFTLSILKVAMQWGHKSPVNSNASTLSL